MAHVCPAGPGHCRNPAIRYVGYMDALETPQEGRTSAWQTFWKTIKKTGELSADQMCQWYSA